MHHRKLVGRDVVRADVHHSDALRAGRDRSASRQAAGTAAGPRTGARKPETPAAVSPAPAAIALSALAAIEESAPPILPKLDAI